MRYIQVRTDEGTPLWRRFMELLNLRYGPPSPRCSPLRTGGLLPHEHRRGVSGSLPGVSSPRRSPGRGTKGAAVHGWAPNTAQPRRSGSQSVIPCGCHEPGALVGAPGAVRTGARQGRIPWPATSPCTASGAPCVPDRQGGRARGRGGRSAAGQVPVPARAGGAPLTGPLLQLQRALHARAHPRLEADLLHQRCRHRHRRGRHG
jgi:hypothetical protein